MKHINKNILLLFFLVGNQLFFTQLAKAQNGFRAGSEQGWGIGWSTTDFWSGTGFGSTFGKTYQNSLGAGNRFFRLYTDWGGQNREHGPSGSSDILIPFNTATTLQTYGGSKAYFLSVTGASNAHNYVFRTRNGNGIGNTPELIVFEVQGAIRSVSNVSQSPLANNVNASNPVEVTATISGNFNTGQGVYLRYSTNNWSTSTILNMTGSGVTYTATIPAQASSTVVRYYVFTSGQGMTIAPAQADWFTINANNNAGSNYSYTVAPPPPPITVSPTFPNDVQSVTVTFNATGTALAGASKVYFHSGVSTTVGSPTSFNHSVGNWGQDDGIGEMTNMGSNQWQIVLNTGLRAFYSVPSEKDIFGLNFLFRNAFGTVKVDNSGNNYFNAVDPGNYITITFPSTTSHFAPVSTNVAHTATASTAPNTWILKEVDPITNVDISTLTTVNGGVNFNYNIDVTNTTLRKFRLTANFGSTSNSKSFTILGYLPVVESPRPAWTKPGINYHPSDPTKVTLVLHAPTYTRYLKGTGINCPTCFNTTPAKSNVFVIGDFNNWTPSESFKLFRDRDGWNGSTDADNDNDRGDYWWIELSGLTPQQSYVFQYLIDGNLQVADPYTFQVSDSEDIQISPTVYPNLPSYPPQAQDRASIIKTGEPAYVWKATPFTVPSINELNIYELHFRDFTEEGTYLAAIDRLDYIKGLGINAIHVMPVSEFEGNSSWGYNPNFYFASDKAYGTPDDLKKFIDECHKRKIQVFNDLVLNHAFFSNVMARMYWNTAMNRPADNNPWFNALHRMVAEPAGWWGADWNHESEHTQIMVDRILDFWLQEFNFDGFRFDFTKGFGQTAQDPGDPWASSYDQDRIDLLMRMVNGMKTRNPGSVVIFEHLAENAEDKVLADQGILMWSGVGHHNDVKGFILGYNGDNTDIYNSGIFNAPARNFTFANWMSYSESHDEERLAYELFQNFNGTKTLENVVNRLKIGMSFNLLFPGPRMIWQFQELGYDFSINFNGRTGEKPVRWNYYDDAKRRELYTLAAKLFKIRNRYNVYSTTPDYGNIGLGAGNLTTPRVMRLSSNANRHVIVVANLDPNTSRVVSPAYDVTGTWYRYNGSTTVDGTTFTVNATSDTYTLAPSEVLVLTNFAIDQCTDVRTNADAGPNSLRDAIQCAPPGGSVTIEFPVYNQTISLASPILIDKDVLIFGFPSKNVTISGSTLNTSIFSIAANRSVTIDGIKLVCSQGGADGRCLVNQGDLTLRDIEMMDVNGSPGLGSSLLNAGNGTLQIQNNLEIKK